MLAPIGAATVAVAVLTRAGGAVGTLAGAALAVALALNLVNDAQLGTPWTPPGRHPGARRAGRPGPARTGGGTALVTRRRRRRRARRPRRCSPRSGSRWRWRSTPTATSSAGPRSTNSSAYGPELARGCRRSPASNDGDGTGRVRLPRRARPAGGRPPRARAGAGPQARVLRRGLPPGDRGCPWSSPTPLFFKGTLGLGDLLRARLPGRAATRCSTASPFFVYRLGREPSGR